MATVFFISALCIQAGFTAYCIITKSNQSRLRSYLRIGALAAFGAAVLLAAVEWSWRWYALAALLLIWAALGALTLLRTRRTMPAAQDRTSTKRVLLRGAGGLLLVGTALAPAAVFPPYELIETTGEHTVATALYTYVDQNRVETYSDSGEQRKLTVMFWYPQDTGADDLHSYPLIVFSHGGLSTKTSNESLYHELASHGYVVGSIDHTYHAFAATDVDGNTTWIDSGYMQETNAENARLDRAQSYAYYQKWMAIRAGDINFVINTVLDQAQEDGSERMYRRIDPSKIGVMGHSLGGAAALAVGRMRGDLGAVIALESPFMYDIVGVEDGEFVFTAAPYPLPVLNVYSDSSWSHLSEWPQYAANHAMLTNPPADAFNVHIGGVGHLALTDFALTSPFLTRILDGVPSTTNGRVALSRINKLVVEFFDCYLKGEELQSLRR